jgi:hypothetical protein
MGVTDQASEVVKSVTEGFKGNPSCLAAIILAGIFAVLTYLNMQHDEQRAQARFDKVIALCWSNIEGPNPQSHERPPEDR